MLLNGNAVRWSWSFSFCKINTWMVGLQGKRFGKRIMLRSWCKVCIFVTDVQGFNIWMWPVWSRPLQKLELLNGSNDHKVYKCNDPFLLLVCLSFFNKSDSSGFNNRVLICWLFLAYALTVFPFCEHSI